MIEAIDLHYRIGGQLIVGPCNFSLDVSAMTAIVGPNGSGKSSLLKILSGDNHHFEGMCQFEGRSIKQWDSRLAAKRRAVVNQFNQIVFPFTAADIVEMGRSPFDGTEDAHQRDAAVSDAMACMGISHLAERQYQSLSGGEQQRVSIARGLCQIKPHRSGDERRYLFLDEPTASLDLKHQHKLLGLLKTLSAHGVLIIIVLHDINLALRYCDNALLTKENTSAKFGAVADVLSIENISNTFEVSATRVKTSDATSVIHVSGAI